MGTFLGVLQPQRSSWCPRSLGDGHRAEGRDSSGVQSKILTSDLEPPPWDTGTSFKRSSYLAAWSSYIAGRYQTLPAFPDAVSFFLCLASLPFLPFCTQYKRPHHLLCAFGVGMTPLTFTARAEYMGWSTGPMRGQPELDWVETACAECTIAGGSLEPLLATFSSQRQQTRAPESEARTGQDW